MSRRRLDPFTGREMNVFRGPVTALIISAALAMAAPAHADGDGDNYIERAAVGRAWDLETLRSHTRKAVPAQYRAGTASVSRGSVRLPELYWPADPWHPE
jgi:hypothetical protein